MVENTPKKLINQNKTSMAKALGLFRDLRAPSWVSRTMYRLKPHSIGPEP